jgi:Lrp/AsnC family transcriptional regulator, leucine-responsive regulatory protein
MNDLTAFVFVGTDARGQESKTAAQIAEIPEVQEAHRVAGEDCYMLKVRVPDMESLGRLISEKLGAIKSVCSARASVVLKTVK